MKKIISCFYVFIVSPMVLAEQYEDPIISKEQIASPEAFVGKINTDKLSKNPLHGDKPRLENFASYNEFLKAMYLYKKDEEEAIRPNMEIKIPSSSVQKAPEYTPIEDNKDIILWGEELPSEYVILGE